MYESWKGFKKKPTKCSICNAIMLKDEPQTKGNMIYVKGKCSDCKCTLTLCYELRLVKDLKLTPKAKTILKARRKDAPDEDFKLDIASPKGRMEVGL
jgi:hypothetical protein